MVMRRQQENLMAQAALAMASTPRVVFRYDRFSDTMTIHFGDAPRPAVSVPIELDQDAIFVRQDREHDQIVGIEIEGFTAAFIRNHPEIAMIIETAELRGITREEAVAIAQDVNRNKQAFAELLQRMAVA